MTYHPKKIMETAEFTMDSGYEKAKKMLSAGDIPDCLFCAADTIALGAMICCREAGIKIPDDMMISSQTVSHRIIRRNT